MDKRSWPWKRKSSSDRAAAAEKAAASPDLAAAASASAKSQGDQVRLIHESTFLTFSIINSPIYFSIFGEPL